MLSLYKISAMNKQGPGDDGSGSSLKRKSGGDDAMVVKLITGGGPTKKSRRECPSPLSTDPKYSANSALSLLQEGTNKAAESLIPSAGSLQPTKKVSVAPSPEVEGVTFPERLMELVMNETDTQALWWLPDGKSFAIHSKKFTKTILAKNFQGSKFESFTRKLARWGFKRLSGPDIPPQTFVFEHPYFQRSRPELAKEISGSKKKAPPPPPPTMDDQTPTLGVSRSAQLSQTETAPWPTVGEQQPTAAETNRRRSSSLYDEMIRQALLQQGLSGTGAASRATKSDASSSNHLQEDLENRLLLQSLVNNRGVPNLNVAESPGRAQRQQDAMLTAAILAKQEERAARARLAAAANASPSAGPTRASVDLAPSLSLPNLTATQNLRRSLTSGYSRTLSFGSDPSPLPSIFHHQQQQQQQQQQQHPTLPTSTSVPGAPLDPLVRLYLQQQEANRQENLLLQQEVLRQELRRRERMQRDQQQRERDGRGTL